MSQDQQYQTSNPKEMKPDIKCERSKLATFMTKFQQMPQTSEVKKFYRSLNGKILDDLKDRQQELGKAIEVLQTQEVCGSSLSAAYQAETVERLIQESRAETELFKFNQVERKEFERNKQESLKMILKMRNLKIGRTKVWQPDKLRTT